MRTRIWAFSSGGWTLLYGAGYIFLATRPSNSNGVLIPYLIAIGFAAVFALAAAYLTTRVGQVTVRLLLVALIIQVLIALIGLLSIGLTLLPAIVSTVVALKAAQLQDIPAAPPGRTRR